jgi:hypothetical protein
MNPTMNWGPTSLITSAVTISSTGSYGDWSTWVIVSALNQYGLYND